MNSRKHIIRAIEIVGLQELAKGAGVSYQAVQKWRKTGRMPHTDASGYSRHAFVIEKMTNGQVTIEQLLGCEPPTNYRK